MKLTQEQVEYAAESARLELTQQEKAQYITELGQILNEAEKLREVPLDEVPPTFHVLSLTNVLREDQPQESLAPGSSPRKRP
ncbi:MAG: Asp-tRNA(Asn)/Glu-tRNA(Gln) amidotransferase subunit GatC [bacterium]